MAKAKKSSKPRERKLKPPKFEWSEEAEAALPEFLSALHSTWIIDIEATGLGPSRKRLVVDEVTEIAITNPINDEVIYHSYVKPRVPFDPEALEKTGFNPDNCINAPSMEEVFHEVAPLVAHVGLSGWNVDFDDQKIRQSTMGYNSVAISKYANHAPLYRYKDGSFDKSPFKEWKTQTDKNVKYLGEAFPTYGIGKSFTDLMRLYARIRGYGTRISLLNALLNEGLEYQGMAHNAAVDCQATANLLRTVASEFVQGKDRSVLLKNPATSKKRLVELANADLRELMAEIKVLTSVMESKGDAFNHNRWFSIFTERAIDYRAKGNPMAADICQKFIKRMQDNR